MSVDLNPISREFFTIHYSQVLSPDDEYIAVSNNFGEVYAVSVKSKEEKEIEKEAYQKLLFDSDVYSLASVKSSNMLLCGSESGQIMGYNWQDLFKHQDEATESRFSVYGNLREVNSMCLLNDESQFVAGYGDGNSVLYDLQYPEKPLLELSGHSDQINQVIAYDRNQFVSCSSDGSICLYDISVGNTPVKKIDVYKNKSVIRPDHSRKILSVALHDRFILCGGGIELSQFDISSGSLLQTFNGPKHNITPYNINYIEVSLEKIGVGISTGSVLAYSHAGHFINQVPVGYGPILNLNSIIDNQFKHTRTVASGIGSKISLLINHGYVSYTLQA